jgi:GT2 family glycosyltransferase
MVPVSTNLTMLAHARPRLLKQALESLGDKSQMTIDIYADDPTIEVHHICREFMQNIEGSYTVVGESKGTGHARNAVIQSAQWHRREYLYLSDDDVCWTLPDWLAVLIEAYEEAWVKGYKVLGAYNHPFHQPIDYIPAGPKVGVYEVQALALQSMLMRWEVFDAFGPFKETPVGAVCQGEDCDFGEKIRADGGKLGVVFPPLLVNCGITNSFGQPIPGWEAVKKEAPVGVIVE